MPKKKTKIAKVPLILLILAVTFGGNPPVGGSTTSPYISEIAASGGHNCVLLKDGTVWCWGDNSYGALGVGSTRRTSTPVQVVGINRAKRVVASSFHTCALLVNETVWCWGDNRRGQLGTGPSNEEETVARPVQVKGLPPVIDLDTGLAHSCAIVKDGTVWCWGYGRNGELGDGRAKRSITPVQVKDLNSATAIVTGDYQSCALLKEGEVWCWGANVFFDREVVPRRVAELPKAIALGAGTAHTCVVLFDRTVQCWGQNFAGQLGNGTDINNIHLSPVQGLSKVVAVGLGNAHSCALLVNGQMRCWGGNFVGQLGNGAPAAGTEYDAYIPVNVSGENQFRLMSVGFHHTCAVGMDDGVRCWGDNIFTGFSPKKKGSFSTPEKLFFGKDLGSR